MDVLLTGVYGRCGTALLEHLYDDPDYDWTLFNRSDRDDDHEWGGYDTVVGNITDADLFAETAAGHDAMVHLAGFPYTDGSWGDVFEPNIVGMYNALEAAREHELETFVFASTNHVMGMYEVENAPELYDLDSEVLIGPDDPVRPDSYYGTTKAFGEDLLRYYVENHEYPKQGYALRICSVRMPEYDHPYGDAEAGVEAGDFERDSEAYRTQVRRMKAMWQSRRDFAHQVACCLDDDDVEFGIFDGVSDNRRRWYTIEHARRRIGYDPQDDAETWDAPPESGT